MHQFWQYLGLKTVSESFIHFLFYSCQWHENSPLLDEVNEVWFFPSFFFFDWKRLGSLHLAKKITPPPIWHSSPFLDQILSSPLLQIETDPQNFENKTKTKTKQKTNKKINIFVAIFENIYTKVLHQKAFFFFRLNIPNMEQFY